MSTPKMSTPELVDVDANGLRFACYVQGDGPLALCFHGFPDTASAFAPTLGVLAELGFRAVAPAMRGYAPSAIPDDGDYHPVTLGRDVLALMDAFEAERATVVGHDWGALATHVAAGLAPERIERLVTLAIPHPRALKPSLRLLWKVRHFITFQWRRRAVRQFKRGDGAYVDAIYRRWSPTWDFGPEATASLRESFREPGRIEAALAYYWAFKDARKGELGATLDQALRHKLAAPTLSFCGADDGATDPGMFEASRRRYSGPFEWVLVPSAGHFPHRENPEVVHEHLRRFVTTDFTTAEVPSDAS